MSGSHTHPIANAGGLKHLWDSRVICACGANADGALLRSSFYFKSLVTGSDGGEVPPMLSALIHPEDRGGFMDEVMEVANQARFIERRLVRLTTPDGRVIPTEVSLEPWRDEAGTSGALLNFIPINHHSAPRADDFHGRELTSTDYFEMAANFIGSLFDAVLLVRPEGMISHANGAALEMLGLRSYELVGRPVASIFEDDPDKLSGAMIRFVREMRKGHLRDVSMTWHGKNGKKVPVTMSGSILRGREGELLGIVICGRDERNNALLKDVVQKNLALQKAYNDLQELDRMKDDLLSLVGHELRAPLANILGYAEFLKEWDVAEEEKKDFVRIIYQESARLTRLVNDILDLSRMEAGRMKYLYVRDSINRVIKSALDSLQPDLEEKRLRIETALDDELEPLEFDPDRVQQVVTNIIHNAIKFTDPGKTISVASESIEGGVRVAIADQGVGIDAVDASKVFNKFEQITDVAHHARGAGLGMPIAKQIVEEGHRGKLWFESEGRGKGTTFKFTIIDQGGGV